ncbi:hypothetical protein M501DRAFT_1012249 [Patellaria atrata CBS 101060]|uniref:Uncharacterized protein n=1 Tax=Patellaria atrata CBS 101060 TaxID=1346257 RepID=A0A9P4SIB7_9PEZI|nr:hypothetical protein M501DRAFT_1012249 [Patellaria atrata CBS 101060]
MPPTPPQLTSNIRAALTPSPNPITLHGKQTLLFSDRHKIPLERTTRSIYGWECCLSSCRATNTVKTPASKPDLLQRLLGRKERVEIVYSAEYCDRCAHRACADCGKYRIEVEDVRLGGRRDGPVVERKETRQAAVESVGEAEPSVMQRGRPVTRGESAAVRRKVSVVKGELSGKDPLPLMKGQRSVLQEVPLEKRELHTAKEEQLVRKREPPHMKENPSYVSRARPMVMEEQLLTKGKPPVPEEEPRRDLIDSLMKDLRDKPQRRSPSTRKREERLGRSLDLDWTRSHLDVERTTPLSVEYRRGRTSDRLLSRSDTSSSSVLDLVSPDDGTQDLILNGHKSQSFLLSDKESTQWYLLGLVNLEKQDRALPGCEEIAIIVTPETAKPIDILRSRKSLHTFPLFNFRGIKGNVSW